MRLVRLGSINVIYPCVSALGGTQAIQQVEGGIAATLCRLNLHRNGAAHCLGPYVATLDPPADLVPLTRTSGVTAQPVAVGCLCRLGTCHDGQAQSYGNCHDD